MKKIDHPQSFFKAIGDNGCYVLCIINIAEQYLHQSISIENMLYYINIFIRAGYIRFNYDKCSDKDNFFVQNPCAILKELTDVNWKVEKKDVSEVKDVPEYAVEQWKNGSFTHFCRRYMGFDPLEYSNTVSNGKIESYRIFTPIE